MPTITMYLSEEEREQLRADAKAEGLSVSALIRLRLSKALLHDELVGRVEALEQWRDEVSHRG